MKSRRPPASGATTHPVLFQSHADVELATPPADKAPPSAAGTATSETGSATIAGGAPRLPELRLQLRIQRPLDELARTNASSPRPHLLPPPGNEDWLLRGQFELAARAAKAGLPTTGAIVADEVVTKTHQGNLARLSSDAARHFDFSHNSAAVVPRMLRAQTPPDRRHYPSTMLTATRVEDVAAPVSQRELNALVAASLSQLTTWPQEKRDTLAAQCAPSYANLLAAERADRLAAIVGEDAAPHSGEAEGPDATVQAVNRFLADPRNSRSLLEALINQSTSDGGAENHDGPAINRAPTDLVEFTVSAIRWLAGHRKTSYQFGGSVELLRQVRATLTSGGANEVGAVGGAAAFGANLLAALFRAPAPHSGAPESVSEVYFYSPTGTFPNNLAQKMGSGVQILDAKGVSKQARSSQATTQPAKVNLSLVFRGPASLSVSGQEAVYVDGIACALELPETRRIIFSTPDDADGKDPGFGTVSDVALGDLARKVKLLSVTGPHRWTALPAEEAAPKATEYGRQLWVMRRANPELLVHHQYVVGRSVPGPGGEAAGIAREGSLFRALSSSGGCPFHSLSLNANEAPRLLQVLASAGLTKFSDPKPSDSEDVGLMVLRAQAITAALGLRRLQLHGFAGDIIVTADVNQISRETRDVADEAEQRHGPRRDFAECVVEAGMAGRIMGSRKASNPRGGQIVHADIDIHPVVPVVTAESLTGWKRFAEMAVDQGMVSAEDSEFLFRDPWAVDADGRLVTFVPSHGLAEAHYTTSLGDTIDLTSLAEWMARTNAAGYDIRAWLAEPAVSSAPS